MEPKVENNKIHKPGKFIFLALILLYFTIIILASVYSYKNPFYNWDMLGYMALVLKMDNADITSAHDLTYSIAKHDLPPGYYHNLVDSANLYRKKMKENPIAFNDHLPFYTIKPLYVRLVYLFYKAGFSLTKATLMPSIFSFILISGLLLYWLKKYLNYFFAFALSLLVILSTPVLSVAKLSTPDALSGLLLFSSFYFILEKPKLIPFILLMVLSVFSRLDNIIISIAILSLSAFAINSPLKISFRKYALAFTILILCYLIISSGTNKYGWNISFYSTFAHYLTSSTYEFQENFSVINYLHLLYLAIVHSFYSSSMTFLFFVLVLLFVYPVPSSLRNMNFDQQFALVLFLIIVVRLIIFPDISDRSYLAFYLVSSILLIRKITNNRDLAAQNE